MLERNDLMNTKMNSMKKLAALMAVVTSVSTLTACGNAMDTSGSDYAMNNGEGENSFRQFFRCAFYDGRVRVTDRFFLYLPTNRWTNSFTNADTTFHDTEFIDPHESALRVVCRRGSTDVQ